MNVLIVKVCMKLKYSDTREKLNSMEFILYYMIHSHRISEVTTELEGEDVTVVGHVKQIRDIGSLRFIILEDETGKIQLKAEDGSQSFEKFDSLSREDCVKAEGSVEKDERAPKGKELIPTELDILSEAETPLPLDPNEKTEEELDTQLDWRVLDLRSEEMKSVFGLQRGIIESFTDTLRSDDFREIFTPCIIGTASEGGSEVFPVHYFGEEGFLRQDPQLHRELAVGGGFERVFELGPSWRAESSNTSRHLCEHRGLSVEQAYIESEKDIMELQEKLIVGAFKHLQENYKDELDRLDVEIDIPERPFPVLEFPEVYEILEDRGVDVEYGEEPGREGELELSEYVEEEYGHDFFFLNRFPFEEKGIFYIMKSDDPEFARSVDLVYNGLEVSTGGQREHRYETVMSQVDELGMAESDVDWYTRFLRYGVPPHSGFTIGIERFTMEVAGLDNIRRATLFPRTQERIDP